jgi:hypothetical protein
MEIKRNVVLNWKEHNIDLQAFDAWCKANLPCVGTSAGSSLTVHLTEEDEIHEASVRAKWEELDDDQHEMALSYKTSNQISQELAAREAAIKTKKLAMLEKTWATMSATERKLVLGLDSEVTNEDLGL